MEIFELIKKQIINKVDSSLARFGVSCSKFIDSAIDMDKLIDDSCVLGITAYHPVGFKFKQSSLSGSYFLGKCNAFQSIIYKSDIRGDELKSKGDIVDDKNGMSLLSDEKIEIKSSFLYKTLVHNCSNNWASLEKFSITNTISCHYANIHGATVQGCFIGALATIDLMNMHSCAVGEFSYVQAPDCFYKKFDSGIIYIKNDDFCFKFKYTQDVIDKYIGVDDCFQLKGLIYDFINQKESEFESLFESVNVDQVTTPVNSAVSRYAVIKGDTKIGENVLVSQKAYLDNAQMGKGANAQENTFIINSTLEGMNVTAHGGKIINADIGYKTFVGFNSFLYGKESARLTIGKACVVMPHTIIDIEKSLDIPDNHVIWGYITCEKDLNTNAIAIEKFKTLNGELIIGDMNFKGKGNIFIDAFSHRIEHILEANGAYFDNGDNDGAKGHAQYDKNIAFNILQPNKSGECRGLYPSISIKP